VAEIVVSAQKRLVRYSSITVRIALRKKAGATSELPPRDLESDREEIRRMVLNSEVPATYRVE